MGLLDRLWSAIGDSLFGGAGRPTAAGAETARAAGAGECPRRLVARQDGCGQNGDRVGAHRRSARRGRTRFRALHADRKLLRCAARGAAFTFPRYARARRGELRSRRRYRLVRGAVASGAGRDAGVGPRPACGPGRSETSASRTFRVAHRRCANRTAPTLSCRHGAPDTLSVHRRSGGRNERERPACATSSAGAPAFAVRRVARTAPALRADRLHAAGGWISPARLRARPLVAGARGSGSRRVRGAASGECRR